MRVKGYKVFNPDWTCRGFQYKVGETYTHDGEIGVCESGFHFCRRAADCFNYYSFDSRNKVAEVEAIGVVKTDGDKSVTDKITIVREIEWQELLTIVNIGIGNTGNRNTGNRNTGNCNTGDWNTGDWNTGDWNTGNRNTGNRNTGNCNTGDWNTGDCNTGNCNTGDWNTGDCNTGFFSTVTPKADLFEKPTDLTHEQVLDLPGMQVLNNAYENNWWIFSKDMTDEEKKQHPEHETTGGYLKTVPFKTACRMMWDKLDAADRQKVLDLPNFDARIFKEVTGIEV